MSKITLDAETFKALASATRLTVLKALDERRKTLTELSHELGLNKATVHEHLGLLLAAGLVRKRDDEGRKWIYYELTWTGQRILRPEATTTFNVLLGLSALAAGGGVLMVGRALDWWLSAADPTPNPGDGGLELRATEENPSQAQSAASDTGSASGAQTSASSGTEPPQGAASEEMGGPVDSIAMQAPDDGGSNGFFDDGGWIALALVAAFFVFCALAGFLHHRLTPKPFDPEAAARAEAQAPPGEPAP